VKYLVAFLLLSCLRLAAFEALVVSVVSGDSLFVKMPDKKLLRIHLAGMDAPEMAKGTLPNQPFAVRAKQELTKIAVGSTVNVFIEKPHEYEGYYAILISQPGICLNTYMVESGFAIPTEITDSYYKDRIEWSCNFAKQNRWGIWSQPLLETPFEFRQRTKKQHLD
jgi:endonuclease YncB( thermonuclease family)